MIDFLKFVLTPVRFVWQFIVGFFATLGVVLLTLLVVEDVAKNFLKQIGFVHGWEVSLKPFSEDDDSSIIEEEA